MTDAPELKPCPFCGGDAYIFSRANDARHVWAHEIDHWISCASEDCYATVGICETERQAITAWNTRAPDPDLEAHIGAVLEEAAALKHRLACDILKRPVSSAHTALCEYRNAILAIRSDAMQALERVRREAENRIVGRIVYEVVEAYEHAADERGDTDRARMARGIAASIRALIAA